MLTKKQVQLLEFINTRITRDGVPPSFDEMKDALDLRSKSGIHRLVTALEERGFIRRLPHRARALEVIRLPENLQRKALEEEVGTQLGQNLSDDADDLNSIHPHAFELPVMGRIAAGVPIEAISEISHHISVPGSMLGSRDRHYALEVRGDSMINAGINDGDVVVIREQSTAETGDIVVALIESHEATLKKLRRKGRMIALEAANPAYETRIFQEEQVKIQGRLVGLIRNY